MNILSEASIIEEESNEEVVGILLLPKKSKFLKGSWHDNAYNNHGSSKYVQGIMINSVNSENGGSLED